MSGCSYLSCYLTNLCVTQEHGRWEEVRYTAPGPGCVAGAQGRQQKSRNLENIGVNDKKRILKKVNNINFCGDRGLGMLKKIQNLAG